MNTVKFQTVTNYLLKMAEKGAITAVDTLRKIRDRIIEIRDNTELIRAFVPNSGTIKMVTPNLVKLPGISTIKSDSLEKGKNQIITAIRVAFASHADSADEVAKLVYSNAKADMPAGLQASVLHIKQNGKTLVELPVSDFVAPANEANSAYKELSAFVLLKEEVPFEVEIEVPTGSVIGTTKSYIEVAMKGMATFDR